MQEEDILKSTASQSQAISADNFCNNYSLHCVEFVFDNIIIYRSSELELSCTVDFFVYMGNFSPLSSPRSCFVARCAGSLALVWDLIFRDNVSERLIRITFQYSIWTMSLEG